MATKTITGQIIDEHNIGIAGLQVEAYDIGILLKDYLLDSKTTSASGNFTLTYDDQSTNGPTPLPGADVRIRIFASGQRLLKEYDLESLPFTIQLGRAYATGWRVTDEQGHLKGFSTGNAIEYLIDNEAAWGRVTEAVQSTQSNFNLLQLEYDLPTYSPDSTKTRLITKFDPAHPLDRDNLHAMSTGDQRLEEVLQNLPAAVQKRIMISVPTLVDTSLLPLFPLALLLELLYLLDFLPIFGLFRVLVFDRLDNEKSVAQYFHDANINSVSVHPFSVSEYTRVHAKLAIIDGELAKAEAFVLGSPFVQNYFNPPTHVIDDPRRGPEATYPPIHDVSISLKGPAVATVHETFRMHWNMQLPGGDQPIPAINAPASQSDNIPVQVVRTLSGAGVNNFGDGETDVLDAYLRAIGLASNYIYLENQYFTNKAIANALVQAIKDRDVPVILLLNIDPDVPCYPIWQVHRIEEILKAIGPSKWSKIGFFSRWTHEAARPPQTKAQIIRNYIHAKVGIIDDKWATVGSANLDGNSLDTAQLLQAVHPNKLRNTEVNCIIFNDVDDLPARTPNPVAELRQALWSEHLGVDKQTLVTPPGDAAGWLKLWRDKAEEKRLGLENLPNTILPASILPFPIDNNGKVADFLSGLFDLGTNPLEYLHALEADLQHLTVGKASRQFSFESGTWLQVELPHY